MGNHTSALLWDNNEVYEHDPDDERVHTQFDDPLLAIKYLSADAAKRNYANLQIFQLTNSATWWSEARANLRFCRNLRILTLEECTAEIAADLGNLLLKGAWYQSQEITIDFTTDNANGIPGSVFNALLDLFHNWAVATEWAAWDMQDFEHGDKEPMCTKMVLTKVPASVKTRAFRA
jgi:hypothetical protein